MGYAEALLARDYGREEKSLRKKAKTKGLWGSIGRTLGGLAATALTGGAATPWAVGLMAAGGTLAGGALGAAASKQKLKGGTFMQEDRASLERQLGSFGEANITGALKAGVTAGIGQATKLYAAGTRAAEAGKSTAEVSAIRRGAGMDFGESALGRGIAKGKAAKELSTMRGFQGQYESLEAAKKSKELTTMRGWEGEYEALPDVKMARKSARIDKMLQERGPLGSAPSIEDVRGSVSGGSGFADLSTQPEYGSGGKSLWEKFKGYTLPKYNANTGKWE